MTTRDKLTFVHAMARHTKATIRQCEALMRYAGTLARLAADDLPDTDWGRRERSRRNDKKLRIANKVLEVCSAVGPEQEGKSLTVPVFAGAVLKIRVPDGEEICVPS